MTFSMPNCCQLLFAAAEVTAPSVTFAPMDWVVLVAYFVGIVGLGMWFGKFTKTTDDFFFGGQRFPWWLVGISCVATLVGSYSFVQYSQVGFNFGFASMTAYTNDWFLMPLFLLGWMPIVYYNRLQSIPEYFEKRFDHKTRMVVLLMLLIYLEGYVGINLLTIGKVMHRLFPEFTLGFIDPVVAFAALMAIISGLYLHAGGQVSVLMTDLFQGILLLIAGLSVVLLGIHHLGGLEAFWHALPAGHRQPFSSFNENPGLNAVGNFWGDGVTATFAFFFINQGVLMRFLSAKSVQDGRRAMLFTVCILMPVVAVAVGGAGWVGRAMVEQGTPGISDEHAFVAVANLVCGDFGLFGLVVAAMVAALMSTLDTLITAVSAVFVNDIWRTVKPGRDDRHYLSVARFVAIGSTMIGIAVIPYFRSFPSIYQALTAFISLITPPLVVVMTLGITWKRFTTTAAFCTLLVGFIALLVSLWVPELITPLAHGVPLNPEKPYSFMRSLFGLSVSAVTAVTVTLFTRPRDAASLAGLTIDTIDHSAAAYKGGTPNLLAPYLTVVLPLQTVESATVEVRLPRETMERLRAEEGDLLYVADARRWLGGFRSLRTKAGPVIEPGAAAVLSTAAIQAGNLKPELPVRIEKIM